MIIISHHSFIIFCLTPPPGAYDWPGCEGGHVLLADLLLLQGHDASLRYGRTHCDKFELVPPLPTNIYIYIYILYTVIESVCTFLLARFIFCAFKTTHTPTNRHKTNAHFMWTVSLIYHTMDLSSLFVWMQERSQKHWRVTAKCLLAVSTVWVVRVGCVRDHF